MKMNFFYYAIQIFFYLRILKKLAMDVTWKCALNTELNFVDEAKGEKYMKNAALTFQSFISFTPLMYISSKKLSLKILL